MIKQTLFRRRLVLYAETNAVNGQINHINTTHTANNYSITTWNSILHFLMIAVIYLAIFWIFMSKLLPRIRRTVRAVSLSIEFQDIWFITGGLTKQSLIDPNMSVADFEKQLKYKNIKMRQGVPKHSHSYTRAYREAEERYILATKNKFLENSLKESFSFPFNHILKKEVSEKRAQYLRDEIKIDSINVERFAWLKKNCVLVVQVNVTGRKYEYQKQSEQYLRDFTQWKDYIVLAKDIKNRQWKIINLVQQGKILEN